MQAPGFWDDQENAARVSGEHTRAKRKLELWEGISADADDAAIVQAIIAMAHGLRLRVVAEGVENERQLDFLRALDNDEYQGFLHSKPLPAAEVERRLMAQSGPLVPAGTGLEEGYD